MPDPQLMGCSSASDWSQPEFTRTVRDYLEGALSAQRICGQDKLLELRLVVDTMAARYGVPAEVLVVIWGMESIY